MHGVVSAWRFKQNGRTYLSRLKDTEAFLIPALNQSAKLRDPPLALGQTEKAILAEAEILKAIENEDQVCQTAPTQGEDSSLRQAPAQRALPVDCNTIEIVKKDGKYSVVLDGVADSPMEPDETDAFTSSFKYWMPRFKEAKKRKGAEDRLLRCVQPVVIAIRLEEMETPPLKATVVVKQRVVHSGTVFMEGNVIKTIDLVPYSVGETTTNVALLPYPMIITPSPYFTINDYSRVLDAELKLHLQALPDAEQKKVREALDLALKSGDNEEDITEEERGAFLKLASVAGWFVKKGLVWGGGALLGNLAAGPGGALLGAAVPEAAYEVSYETASLFWNYLFARSKIGDWTVTTKQKEVIEDAFLAAIEAEPKVHQVTLAEFSKMLYRIAETRANGSVTMNTDNTIGMSVHDLRDNGWEKEAALLEWMQNGSGRRPSQDKVSGIYSAKANTIHAADMKNKPQNTPVTFNTIGVVGMDALSNCNSRTEFFIEVQIVEADGSDGPTVVLNSTRINGIDAGWISSGYEKQFEDCNHAVDCLRSRLSSLPGTQKFMSYHSTLVADSNHGAIVGDVLDERLRAIIARQLEGGNLTKDQVTKMREDANKLVLKAGNAVTKQQDQLTKKRAKVEKTKKVLEQLQSADNPNKKALKQLQSADNPNQDRIDKTLRQLRVDENAVKEVEKRLLELNKDKRIYENQARRKSDPNRKQFAAIFDYQQTIDRIRSEILGYPKDYGFEADDNVASQQESEAQDSAAGRTFWQRMIGSESPTDPEEVKEHYEYCTNQLAMNLGINRNVVSKESTIVARFIGMLSPVDPKAKNPESMRFSAFLVPKRSEWLAEDITKSSVVRLMPQMMSFSRTLVSAFGQVTIMQPEFLSDTMLINRDTQRKASQSIGQARVALRRSTEMFDIANLTVMDQAGHFNQLYFTKDSVPPQLQRFGIEKPVDSFTADYLALSMLPCTEVVSNILLAERAGGKLFSDMLLEAAATKYTGVSEVILNMGLDSSFYSLLAIAYFSEILAYYICNQGSSGRGAVSFELQKVELSVSAMQLAKRSASEIGQFLKSVYGSKTSRSTRIVPDDVAFYCFPGMQHLRTMMRRVGVISEQNVQEEFTAYMCARVGSFLVKLGSASKIPVQALPFTCVQSSISSLPAAVRALPGYESALVAHMRSAWTSFERCKLASLVLITDKRLMVKLLSDVVNSRPIVVKAFKYNKSLAEKTAYSTSNIEVQKHWKPHSTQPGIALVLAARMAALRIDIGEAKQLEKAIDPRSFMGEPGNAAVYDDLVASMNQLGTDDFLSPDDTVANYMVPFGAQANASLKDIWHSEFENSPVWITLLRDAALSVFLVDARLATYKIYAQGQTMHSRQYHPLLIRTEKGKVFARMYPMANADESWAQGVEKDEVSHVNTLATTCLAIDNPERVSWRSTSLSKHYRLAMHNAERIFQACLVMASRVAMPGSDSRTAGVVEVPSESNEAAFIASICIGNAMARAYAGPDVGVHVLSAQKPSVDALQKIVLMCDEMLKRSIKAVPFCEMCACASLV